MKKEIIPAAFKKTTIYFPPDLHKWLKTIAAQRGVTMTELIVRAVEVTYPNERKGRDKTI